MSTTTICAGYSPSATITAGSGGSTGAADLYEYSIDNGGAWSTYTSGSAITTTGATGNVLIRVSRSGGSYGCSGTGPTTIVTWPVSSSPTAPALSSASPASGSVICAGFNTGTVTGSAGSGGSAGAVDEYQYSINGGSTYNAYTSGSAITTTGATTSVIVQSRRTGGSYGCSNTSWSTLSTWTVGSAMNAGSASSTPTLCVNTTLTNITHTTTGATGIGSATGLPTGVTATWASNTITISGTPTVSGIFNYSIPLTGDCGTVNATGTITVTSAPSAPTSNNSTVSYDGSSHSATATVSVGETVDWYTASTSGSLTTAPTGINFGTYTAWAEARNTTTGCISTTRTLVTLTINKAELTITAGNQSVGYGSAASVVTTAGSYTPTGFVQSETASVISGIVTYTTNYTNTTAAGTSGITITPDVTGLTALNYVFNPVRGDITITAVTSTITATGSTSYTYTGLAQGPATATVTGSTGAVTYSYSGTGTTSYGPSATAPTAAGTYQVIASVAADANYSAATSAAYAFTINKATLTITAANQSLAYGTPIQTVIAVSTYTPTGFVNSETASVISGSVTYTTNYTNTTAAGTSGITITPDVTGLTALNYVFNPVRGDITITGATSTITATGTTTYTYTGTPQGPATATVTGSTGAVTYSYSGTGTTSYSASATQPTAAGTYQVIASVAADANYGAATSAAYGFTINKATLTITAANQSVAYGTAVSAVTTAGTYTPTGFVNGETASVISGSATYTTTYTNTTPAGTSGVTITPILLNFSADNYSFTAVNGTITITGATSTITATGSTSYTYTGAPQGPATATVTGSTGAVTYSYSGTGTTSYGPSATAPTAAGTYQVIASVAADANYSAATSATYAFTINKATLNINAANQLVAYGTPVQTVITVSTYTPTGFVNSETAAVISGTVTYVTTYTNTTTAGTSGVTITPVVTGLTALNYTFNPVRGDITITPVTTTIVVTGSTSYTYTGLAQGPATATVTGSTGAVTYSYSGTGTTTYSSSATPPTAAGTYQVIAKVAADANYAEATSAAYAFTINKAVITITAANQTVVYGTAVSAVTAAGTYAATGFVNSETASVISGTATYTTTYTNTTPAGTSGVTLTPILLGFSANNYTFTAADGTITILKAGSSITALGGGRDGTDAHYHYTGTPQGPTLFNLNGSTGAVTFSYAGTGSTAFGPGSTKPIVVGTYTATATVAADANFEAATSAPLAFRIDPAVLNIKAANQSVAFGTPVQTVINAATYTPTGFVNSETASVISGTATYTTTYTASTPAGKSGITITPDVTGLTAANYLFNPVNGTIVVTAAQATTMAINAGDGQTATAGTSVATAPSVIVKDAGNNPVAGVTVTFAIASGGGSAIGLTATTNASGIATVGGWTLGQIAGMNTMTATSGTLSGSPLTFTATATTGALHHFAVTLASGTQVAGTAFAITITAQDAYNNNVTGFTGTADLSTTAGTITPAITSAFVNGARVESVTLTQSGTFRTITATKTGSTETGTSNTFTVNPSAPLVGAITQPTCATSTGSVALSGLPATGYWTVMESVGSSTISGTGTTGIFTNLAPGTYTFIVTNSTGCTSTASANAVIVESICADLSLTMAATPDPVSAGQLVTYTIALTNRGNSDAQAVSVSDILPAGLTLMSATPSFGSWSAPNWTLGTLANGHSETLVILAKVNPSMPDGTTITNSAALTSTTFDQDVTNNSATTTIQTEATADLKITNSSLPEPVVAGQNLTYTITVENMGTGDAQAVSVLENLPAGVTLVSATPSAGTWTSPKWTLGALSSGASATMTVVVTVNSNILAGATISNTVKVSSDTFDPDATNNSSAALNHVDASADLSITKTASPNPVVAGQNLTYTINISNIGPSDARNVLLSDAVPASLGHVEYSPDNGSSWLTWTGTFNHGTLAAGNNITVLIRGTVNSNVADGSVITNTGTVSGSTSDPVSTNNSATQQTTVTTSADLYITQSGTVPLVGNPMTYTLSVFNIGPSNAQSVVFADALATPSPFNAGTLEYSENGGSTWNSWTGTLTTGSLAAGNSRSIQVRGTLNSAYAGTTLSNTAIVSGATADPNAANNTYTIETPLNQSANLSIVKSCNTSPVVAGQPIEYKLSLANAGPSDASQVKVTDFISSEYISAPQYSINNGTTWLAWTHSLDIGTLASGANATILIKGTVLTSVTGAIPGTATISSPVADPVPADNTSTISTPVSSNANLTLTATCGTNPVVAGQSIQYAITVNNAGPGDALAVSVADVVPSTIKNVEYSLDNGAAWLPWTSPYVNGTLPAGNSLGMLIRGVVGSNLPDGTVITNTAAVSSSTTDPDGSNNSASVNSTVTSIADLTINQTDSPDPSIAGLDLTYTLTVTNNGPSDALGVSIADAVPASLGTVEYSLNNGSTWAAWSTPYLKGTLPAGTSFVILIHGIISSSVPHGTVITNTATVTSTTADPNSTNNIDSENTKVNARADLSITKTDSPDPVIAGKPLTYTITVTSIGPSDARNVAVTDLLPSSILSAEYSSDNGSSWHTWVSPYNYGTLPAGNSFVLMIRGIVNSKLANGALIANTARVSSTTADPVTLNNVTTETTQVNTIADLSITKTGTPDPAIAGQTITYTITVSNSGPSDARLVKITDNVPASIGNLEYSPNNGSSWLTWTGDYTNGTLPVGNSLVLLIRGIVNSNVTAGTVISNTATVSSATSDPVPANNSQTAQTTVNASADLSVTVAGNLPVAGSPVTYTLSVFNIGPSDAQSVTVSDALAVPSPFNAGTVQYSSDGGSTWNTWTGSLNNGSLTARTTLTLLLRGTLSSSYSGSTLSNTASVSSTTADSDLTNNTYTIIEPLVIAADLSIVKTCNTASVVAGQQIEYKLSISNAGPGEATGVTVFDYMESSVISSQEYSTNNGLTWLAWTNSLNIGTIANGGTTNVLIRGNVMPKITLSLKNTASVTGAMADPDLSNNTSTITTPLTSSAALYLSKVCSTNPVIAGELIQYTITVGNAGPSDALNVVIADDVPAVIADPEYSLNNGASWIEWTGSLSHGTLPAGNSITMLIRGTLNPDVPSGSLITNTAFVTTSTSRSSFGEGTHLTPGLKTGNTGDNNSATASTRVSTRADLILTDVSNPDPVIAGQNLTYTITVTNEGPSDAQNVSVANSLPTGLALVSGSPTAGTWTSPSWNVGTLAAGESATLVLVTKVNFNVSDGTVLINTSRVNSTTYDPLFGNNLASEPTHVYSSADLSITKTGTPDPVIAGQVITYTIAVKNNGPSDANALQVTDVVPASVLNPQWSTNGGASWNNWGSTYDYGILQSGASFSFLIRGTVDQNLSDVSALSNTATVNSITVDPDPRNNTATFASNVTVCQTPPVVGTITQPTCSVATGSVVLTGLPTGNWTINPGAITGSTSTVTINNLSAGNSYYYTVTNALGCTSAASASVVINAQPSKPASPVAVNVTVDYDGQAHAATATVGTGETVDWYTAATGGTLTAAPSGTNTGTYTAWAEARNSASGCVSDLRTQVTLIISNVRPVITSALTATSVYGKTATYQIIASNNPTTFNATGLPSGMTIAQSTGLISIGARTSAGVYHIYMSATNQNGTGNDSLVYTVEKAPVTALITAISKCYDGSATAVLSNKVVLGVIYPDVVTLLTGAVSFSDAAVGTGKTVTATGLALGGPEGGNYYLTSTSVITYADIYAGPLAPTFTVVQPDCSTSTGSVIITGPLGSGLTYSVNDVDYQASAAFTNLRPGTYQVTVKNQAGCISASSVCTINQPPVPPATPAFTLVQPTCAVATGTIGITSPLGSSLSYSINGIDYQSSSIFGNVIPGSYQLYVKNSSGCISIPATAVVNVQPSSPVTSSISGNTNLSCSATGITYSVILTNGSSYAWTVPAGATITAGASGPNNNQITVTFGVSGGNIAVTETNSATCTGSTKTLPVNVTGCAPVAINDLSTGNTPGGRVTLNILANDRLGSSAAAPALVTVDLDPSAAGVQTSRVVPGEGSWTYNTVTGEVTFVPEAGFYTNPTPVVYVLTEKATLLTATATITVEYTRLPDLSPEITISPATIAGTTNIDVIVKVNELNMANTNGLITVVIPKDSRWTINGTFDPSLTELISTHLNNADWTYSSNPSYHIFTTTSVITAGSRSVFGFRVTFNPGSTKGISSFTSQILSGSGGEVRIDNNADSKKLEYTDK